VKKILVISFTFPPVEGIGGRRWAKFSKYFLRENVDVVVLTAKLPSRSVSEWEHDIAELKNQGRIHFFDTHYPEILVKTPKSLVEKVLYRWHLMRVKTSIKGNYYDKSALCRKSLLQQVEKFVREGYHNIVVSIGPFFYSSFFEEIKTKYPGVNLILDVRDPWTNNKTSFGYATLEPKRFRIEKEAEKKVAGFYDHIVSVADDMGAYFITEYAVPEHKIATIKNGFDREDIPPSEIQAGNVKNIVFTGNLYEKAETAFRMLSDQLKHLKKENPEIFKQYAFHFYGEIHPSMKNHFDKELNLFFHHKIPLKEVYEKISNASACLLFLTDDLNYSFSTKFYEYLSLEKPILVFSKPGKTGEFVEQHQIGRQMSGDNLLEVLTSLDEKKYYSQSVDISAYDVKQLSKQYLTLIR
jgi:glycosyltransferase involved in cell wall biosynthesis